MNILIIGQGGREHAMYHSLRQSDPEGIIHVLPGNGGVPLEDCVPLPMSDFEAIRKHARAHQIDFILVGPEQPLVDGIVDFFQKDPDIFVFGPTAQAARLEGSKAYAKEFMEEFAIPTAQYRTFTEIGPAQEYLHRKEMPIVVKASGLAAGKGVTVCFDRQTALLAVEEALSGRAFGESGKTVVVEDFLEGREASIFVVTDGEDYQILGTAQDYKRVFDGDQGANTGGMGAFSPALIVNEAIMAKVKSLIIEPTIRGMAQRGTPYTGILYVGLMISSKGEPGVVEYNCRMGDPETQVVLPLLLTPLQEVLSAARDRKLGKLSLKSRSGFAVTVVLAKEGYPGPYAQNIPVTMPVSQQAQVFHAGTARNDQGLIVSTGGRVLNITGVGATLRQAREEAYDFLTKYHPEGFFYRNDIGLSYI